MYVPKGDQFKNRRTLAAVLAAVCLWRAGTIFILQPVHLKGSAGTEPLHVFGAMLASVQRAPRCRK